MQGRRVNEVLSLKWKDLYVNEKVYAVLAENNKAGKQMEYALDDDLLDIIQNTPHRGEYIFPAIKDPKQKMHNDTLKKHWVHILKKANLVTIDEKTQRVVPQIRIHDLRHIVGLKLVNAGVSLEVIASVLGHTTTSITKRYSKVRTETAANAMLQFKELIK